MPDYLLKSRHDIYYFRLHLPSGKELRRSLRTRNKREARLLAYKQWAAIMETQTKLRYDSVLELEHVEAQRDAARQSRDYWQLESELEELDEIGKLRAHIRFLEEQLSEAPQSVPITPVVNPVPIIHGDDISLSDAISRFLAQKTAEQLDAKSIRCYAVRLDIFRRILIETNGNHQPMLSQITSKMMRDYHDILKQLPKRVPATANIIRLAKHGQNQVSAVTKTYHIKTLRAFLAWAESQQYAVAPRLDVFGKSKIPRASQTERQPFTQQELQAIFHSNAYRLGTFGRAMDYWLPLLALFTGARQNELAQLYAEDIRRDHDTGIWVVDINNNRGKKLKVESTARLVPIHPTLRKLGFIAFARAKQPDERLFPEKLDKYGYPASYSKRFGAYLKRRGVHQPLTKVFHSFRHTTITWLDAKGCPEPILNMVAGHSKSRQSESTKTYAHGNRLSEVQKWITKLEFGIDFTVIREDGWKHRLK